MPVNFGENLTTDVAEALEREWLETNGLGGWASSTIVGANTRRYHGLLVAAVRPPGDRMVLLSKLDETLLLDARRVELGCNRFPGAIHPRGYEHLRSFSRDLFPIFEYAAEGVRLRKTVAAVHGENTTLVLYEVLEAPAPFTLELRPLTAFRDCHGLSHANAYARPEAGFKGGVFRAQPYDGVPALFISVPGADFIGAPDWHYRFEYGVELARGLDGHEDLLTHGVFRRSLTRGDRFGIVASTDDPGGRDAFRLFDQERERRQNLLPGLGSEDDLTRALTLAADQFVVRRGENQRTVIAGYPWFADWGRDTMIALPGLCLTTGRFDDAKRILRTFAGSVREGLLPNRFCGYGEEPEYNTVDAGLWLFVAVWRYLEATGDEAFVRDEILPVLLQVIERYDKGTRYGIRVDEDGLVCSGEPGVQLTWMDVKVGDKVLTPRQGKAVEVNALWYNALVITAALLKRLGKAPAASVRERARGVKDRFVALFWNEAAGCLYDVVGSAGVDAAIRPNQILALSLPHALLPRDKAARVMRVIEEKLYTPFGLRSLSPDHPDYRGRYEGGPSTRDAAYHEGTVWSWLLGPYITALIKTQGASGRKRARTAIEAFVPHLADAGVGTISEIFDGDPPHAPRGCIAQAWSVAEVLRAWVEEIGAGVPVKKREEAPKKAVKTVRSPVKTPGARRGKKPKEAGLPTLKGGNQAI